MNFVGEVINRNAVNKLNESAKGWICPMHRIVQLTYFSASTYAAAD